MTPREPDDDNEANLYVASLVAFVIFALMGVWKTIDILVWILTHVGS